MNERHLDRRRIVTALQALGSRLSRPADILLIGGAAGLLTGAFDASAVTEDVDLMACIPAADREDIFLAAEVVGRELALPASWLSDFAGLFRWTLPDDWRDRAVHVGTFGHLTVLAAGRLDLMLMKFLANRTKDREHLMMLSPTDQELTWIADRLRTVGKDFPNEQSKIEKTMQSVAHWNDI